MKIIVALFLSTFILFNLVGCNTNTATPELESTLEAEQTPYYTPLQEPTFSCNPEPTADPTSTPEETWEGIPTPSPSILETPSGHYANGVAYYSVEENPQLIYDPYYVVGYYGALLPLTGPFESILEEATDASDLNPETLPVIRLQSYVFRDKLTRQIYYTERTPEELEAFREILKQKFFRTNQFTGLNATEENIHFYEDNDYFVYQKETSIIKIYPHYVSFSYIDAAYKEALLLGLSGKLFLNKIKDYPHIQEILQYAGYQNPTCKRSVNFDSYQKPTYTYYIYDETENPAQNAFNQQFNFIRLTAHDTLDRAQIDIYEFSYDSYTSKEFEAISYEEARQKLLNGEYYTSAPLNEFPEEDVEYAELVYTTQFSDKYYTPAYLFYVNLHNWPNKNHYGLYYVPAVTGLEFDGLDVPPGPRPIY